LHGAPALHLRGLLRVWLLLAAGLVSLLLTVYLASLGHTLHVRKWEYLPISYWEYLRQRSGSVHDHSGSGHDYLPKFRALSGDNLPSDLWAISIYDGFAISELHAIRIGPIRIRDSKGNPYKEEKKYYLPAEYEAMKAWEAALSAAMKAMLRAPAWSQFTDQELFNPRNKGGREVALGWPFRWLVRSYPGMWNPPEYINNDYLLMSCDPAMTFKLGLWVARNHPEYIRIWWPGLIGNFLLAMPVSMAVLGSIRLGFVAVRRSRRKRRGVCGSCGYPVQPGSDRCPECGKVHSLPIV
jgi:hypothetical protein